MSTEGEFRTLDAYRVHRAWAEYQGRNGSPSTVRKDLTRVGTPDRIAKRWGVFDENPALDVEKPPEPEPQGRSLSIDEWDKFAAQFAPTIRSAALFALTTGSRLREVAGPRWADVDQRAGLAYVTPENKTTRSKRVRFGGAAKAVLVDIDRVRRDVARVTWSVPQ